MIIGMKILEVDGKKQAGKAITTFNLNLKIDDVKVDGENIEMKYTYIAAYNDDSGHLTMKGILLAKEKKELVKAIEAEWSKNKKLPEEYSQLVLSVIAHSGAANGTLLARIVDLPAPILPPAIKVAKQ